MSIMDFATNEITFNKNREIFINFYRLCSILNEFEIDNSSDNAQKLIDFVASIGPLMPLPSGSFGNSLAVALEMRFYNGALFMIKNLKTFKIDLNFIANKINNRNYIFFNALEVFKISQIGCSRDNKTINVCLEIESILQDKFKVKSR